MAEEKEKNENIASIADARRARSESASPNQGTGSDGAGDSKPRKRRTTRKSQAKKRSEQFEELLPLATFRDYSDEALDIVPNLLQVTPASEGQKKAVATCGRNVICKRLDNAENFDEIMLILVCVPLALRWGVEILRNLAKEKKARKMDNQQNEKQAHTNTGQVGGRQV